MPVLTVIAGPNGSGKTTLIQLLERAGIDFGQYFNADDIARNLIGSPASPAALAQQIVRDKRQAALLARADHTFETVMSHASHIEHMHRARAAGFEVRLYFVATEDPVINLDRVARRVDHGGHDVPAVASSPVITAAWRTCQRLLPPLTRSTYSITRLAKIPCAVSLQSALRGICCIWRSIGGGRAGSRSGGWSFSRA